MKAIAMRLPHALCGLLLALVALGAWAQDYDFEPPPAADDAGLPEAIRDLAERVLPVYEDADRLRYLSNLSALQLAAGEYAAAADTRNTLRERRRAPEDGKPGEREALYDLYAQAKAAEAAHNTAFAQAFTQAFRDAAPLLGDREAYAVIAQLRKPLPPLQQALRRSLERARAKQRLSQAEVLDLVWAYVTLDALRSAAPLAPALLAEDDPRRYLGEDHALIETAGVPIEVQVFRPRNTSRPVPALLQFSLAAAPDDARACAAHGYAGVVAWLRRRSDRSEADAPFRHEGEFARAVIAWIGKQPWSDGRVGMYGERYAGFAAWAALKHPPAALKAIATADPMAPGIDFPNPGRIFRNSAYRWALSYAGALDPARDEDAQWQALDRSWYQSGRPYRDLELLAHQPSLIFRRWLGHPSYDRYWQKMIPFGKEFARIGIPVLTLTTYAGDGAIGGLYYFSEHLRQRPDARHALVIASALEQGAAPRAADAAAVDLSELRWQWFDQVFRNAPQPALLQDRVNWQLSASGEWRHAPTLQAMSNGRLRLYLDAAESRERQRLVQAPPADGRAALQTLKLADRGDAHDPPQTEAQGRRLVLRHGLSFVGEPLPQPLELGGLISGQLDLTLNKQDVDLNVALYERLAGGEYLPLCAPDEFRASYAADRVQRQLLKAGERQQLHFSSERPLGRRLQAGSRLVLVLGVNKRPDREINYGSGKDVGEESIADAGPALRIVWHTGSYIELPVRQ